MTIQQQLSNAIILLFPDATVKKIDVDNHLDIHIPGIHEKQGSHLYFNTAKNVIKLGFYVRDVDFVNEVIQRAENIEDHSQGLRISGNPEFYSVKDAVEAAKKFLEEIVGVSNSLIKEISDADSSNLTSIIKSFSQVNADELCGICESLLDEQNESSTMFIYDLDYKIIKRIFDGEISIDSIKNSDFILRDKVDLNDWDSLSNIVGENEANENRKEYETESYPDDASIAFVYSGDLYVYSFLNEVNDSTKEPANEDISPEDYEDENSDVEYNTDNSIQEVSEEEDVEEECTEEDDSNEDEEDDSSDVADLINPVNKMAERWRAESDERLAVLIENLLLAIIPFNNRGANENEISHFMVEFENLLSEEIILNKTDILNEVRQRVINEWNAKDFDAQMESYIQAYEKLVTEFDLVSELNKSLIRLHCLPNVESDYADYLVLVNLGIPLPVFSKVVESVENEEESDSDDDDYDYGILSVKNTTTLPRFYDKFLWSDYSENRIVVQKNNQLGVIDLEGKQIVPCSYQNIILVNQNLFWGQTETNWILLDNNQNKLLEVEYELLEKATESLFYVKKNDLFGVINLKGEELISVKYEAILPFKENMMAVFENGIYVFYDIEGKKMNFPPIERINSNYDGWAIDSGIMIVRIDGVFRYLRKDGVFIGDVFSKKQLNDFSGNIAVVKDDASKYGIIDTTGKLLIPHKYDHIIITISQNFVYATLNGLEGVINLNGDVIIPFEYDNIFLSDIAEVFICNKDEKARIFDFSGKMLLDFLYDSISENFGAVNEADKKWLSVTKDGLIGFYNLDTHKVIDCFYDDRVGGFDDGLVCVVKNEKHGYVDTNGKLIGDQFYDTVAYNTDSDVFRNNLSYVNNGDLYAYIDKSGKLMTDFVYTDARLFLEGFAIVADKNNLFGVVNTSFEPVILFQYQELKRVYSSPTIFIAKNNKGYGLVDTQGNILLDFIYEDISTLESCIDAIVDDVTLLHGMFCVKREKIELNSSENKMSVPYRYLKYGLVDSSGRELIPPVYEKLELLTDGLWKMNEGELYGVINASKTIIIPALFTELSYSDGFIFTTLNEKKGVYNTKGSVVLPNTYTNIDLKSGYFFVTSDQYDGIFSSSGEQLIPLEYNIFGFSDGLFFVQNKSKYGFLNEKGLPITNEMYDDAHEFNDGLALVKKENSYLFIDTTGRVVLSLDCDKAYPFKNGFAVLIKNDKYGLINKEGKFVLPFEFDDIDIVEHGFIVYKEENYTIYNSNFEKLFDFLYDSIYEGVNGYILCLDSTYDVCNLDGELIIVSEFSDIRVENNYYVVCKNDLQGLYDQYGNELLPAQYENISTLGSLFTVDVNNETRLYNPNLKKFVGDSYKSVGNYFFDGLAQVMSHGLYGFVSESGALQIPLEYGEVRSFSNGMSIVKKNGKFGVISNEGKTILPFEYDQIHNEEGSDCFSVWKDNKCQLVNKLNEKMIPVSFDAFKEYDPKRQVAVFGNYFDSTVAIDQVNTFVINDDQYTFTIGYDTNCYVSEDVMGVLSDDLFLQALSSGESWSSYSWDNNWFNTDDLKHTYGICEPATDLKLPDGTIKSIKILYNSPNYSATEDAFIRTSKGDFVQIASSSEKAYGWEQWKEYSITFNDFENYASPFLKLDTIVNGIHVKGIFDVRQIKVNFESGIVDSYEYGDEGISFEESDNYQTTGQGYESALYFNNGTELVEIDLEELSTELEENKIDKENIQAIKDYLINK